jgi:hypothetical protein
VLISAKVLYVDFDFVGLLLLYLAFTTCPIQHEMHTEAYTHCLRIIVIWIVTHAKCLMGANVSGHGVLDAGNSKSIKQHRPGSDSMDKASSAPHTPVVKEESHPSTSICQDFI